MIGVGNRWGVGRNRGNPFSGDMSEGNIFRTLHRMLVLEADKRGPVASLFGTRKLPGVLSEAAPGEHIYLAAGVYAISNAITIDKSIRITGLGRVKIMSEGTAFNITGDNVTIRNIEFLQRPVPATVGVLSNTISVSGSKCRIDQCIFDERQAYGIYVTGDQCAVVGCRFAGYASHTAANADIYYSDSADEGIVAANTRSKTARTFTLSYKAGTDMSESANGPASTIEIR